MTNTVSNTTSVSKAGDRTIVITRDFDAAPSLVFRAFTDPALIARWWGPRSLTTVVDRIEPRAGGVWRFRNHDAAGNEYGFHGVFHAVHDDRQIVRTFEFEGEPDKVSLDTTTFAPVGGNRTRVIAVSVFQSPEDCDAMLASGVEAGVVEFYEQLDELLREPR
jgi:uncharacterized protein YndB with AHSA1/START domain